MSISRTIRLSSSPTNQEVVRWGILSAGRISSDFAKAMAVAPSAIAAAVAARSVTDASYFATQHSIPKHHKSYNDLLADPSIDVMYIGTIADHHYEWARNSILAGKATVVEKPMSLCFNDTKSLIDLAKDNNVFLMEGMWTRCFPAMHKLRELISTTAIGEIIYASADFGWKFPPTSSSEDDRIWLPNSGGITLDVGMYVAQFGRVAFSNSTIKNVHAMGNVRNGVDYTVAATVTYDRSSDNTNNGGESSSVGDGLLQMTLTGAANTEERCVLQGTKGRIIIDGPFHVPQKLRVQYDTGREEGNNNQEVVYDFPLPHDPYNGVWNNPGSIGFIHQIEEVSNIVRESKKLESNSFTWRDSLDTARIVDEIVYQVRGERDILL